MDKKPVFIDCDTGIDDAMALALAVASDNIDIIGVSTVSGNVSLEATTRNTCNVLNYLGRADIPVAVGADKPLKRASMKASGVHGVSGLRGWSFEKDYKDNIVSEHAVDFMAHKILLSEEKVIIAALAPVTNIALMLNSYPETKENIESIVFMGTSWHDGNPTPITTFNVLVDPEAFRYVLNSGVKVIAAPLDTLRYGAIMHGDEIEEMRKIGNPVSDFVYSILTSCGVANIRKDEVIDKENEEEITKARIERCKNEEHALLDPAAMALIVKPELFVLKHYYADVECSGELTTGFTLIDKKNFYGKTEDEKNLWFAEEMDRKGFVDLYLDAIRSYGDRK